MVVIVIVRDTSQLLGIRGRKTRIMLEGKKEGKHGNELFICFLCADNNLLHKLLRNIRIL